MGVDCMDATANEERAKELHKNTAKKKKSLWVLLLSPFAHFFSAMHVCIIFGKITSLDHFPLRISPSVFFFFST